MSKKYKLSSSLIAVLLGMLIGAVLMLIFGYDPFLAIYDLFTTAFGSLKNIGEILRAMSPSGSDCTRILLHLRRL